MKSPYLSYFNLTEEPFSTVPNPRFFSPTPMDSSALGKTKFTIDARKGLATVIGNTGTGKSTLARLLHENFLDAGYISVLLTNPNFPTLCGLRNTMLQGSRLNFMRIARTLKWFMRTVFYQQVITQASKTRKQNIAEEPS